MVQIVIFINLFFVPVVPLYMTYRKKQIPLRLNLDLLFQYCITAACNIPLTKVFIFLMRKARGVFISIDSGFYTLAALVSALLIYILYIYQDSELNKKYWIQQYTYYKTYLNGKSWIEKITQRGAKRIFGELIPVYLLVFASCFMMLIFEPILLYSTNMDDFWFDFSIMLWPVLGVFACFLLYGILIVSVIYFVNLRFSGRILLYKGLSLVGFIVFFLLYLQGNWLAGNLPPLTGAEIVWENYGKSENSILMTSVVFLSIATIIGIRRFKLDYTIRYAAAGAGIISVMLFVSLIPTVIVNDAFKSKDTFSPTMEHFNTVSTNQNVFVFLVDSVDSKTFYNVMTHDEDFFEILDDFTYYPDTLSVYPVTKNSIPNILTGAINYNETDYFDYSNSAYNLSPLFKKLEQKEYSINLYSHTVAWGGHRNFEIENSASIYDTNVSFKDFMEQELKYIRYKYLPYGFKQYSRIETLDFNVCQVSDSTRSAYSWWNDAIYNYIQENNVLDKRSENYFHFIHCEGGHVPCDMDKYMNRIEDGTYEQKVAATLTMIKTYLQRLKDNDAYDNSAILIMADHGYQLDDTGAHLVLSPIRCNPILFIKGFNEKHKLLVSDRPVSYLDLQDAFCDLVDGKQSTELFTELQPGRTRTVMWHEFLSPYHIVEYETKGKAWEIEEFVPTGNVYDLEG